MTRGVQPIRFTSATRLVLLLSVGVFINYVDRGNLATAAPLIQGELRLSASQLGVLLSAFYYGYVVAMSPVGWLAEKYGAHRVLGAGAVVWSTATLFTGFASSFAGLLMLRLLLGAGESAAFPCASKLLAQAVQVSRLGVANGVLSFGYLLGPAVGTLLGGLLMTKLGWRPAFILFGICSLAWLLPTAASIATPCIYEVLAGLSSPAIFAIPQIFAGPDAAGRWVGVQNTVGGMAGLIAPVVTGILVDQTGHFGAAFGVAAALQVFGFIGWVFVLPKIAPCTMDARSGLTVRRLMDPSDGPKPHSDNQNVVSPRRSHRLARSCVRGQSSHNGRRGRC